MRMRLVLAGVAAILLLPAAGASAGFRVPISPAEQGPFGATADGGRVLPFRATNRTALKAAKRRAERRREAQQGAGPSPHAAVVGGLNQPGLDAQDGDFAVPPDTTGSIGPSHYVEMVNDAAAVYSRSTLGRVAGPLDLEHFMNAPGVSTPSSNDDALVTDPQVQWDQRGGRWFYLAAAFIADNLGNPVGPNVLLFGFSKTSDPTNLAGGWCKYQLPSLTFGGQNLLDDYPKLGHNDSRLVFGTNVFNEDGDFLTARIWSVPKPAAGPIGACPAAGSAIPFPGSPANPLLTADGDKAATPVPANTSDASAVAYVVAADDPTEEGNSGPKNQIMAWHVSGTSLIPDGNIGVSTYDVPPSALQPGPPLDTLDGRLTMAVARRDPAAGQEAVWTQHTIDPGNGTVVMRWYELLPGSLGRRQQGTVSDPTEDVYNGAVSPGSSGDFAAFFFNRSGLNLAPEIRGKVRGPATPLGGAVGDLLLGTSDAGASDFSCIPLGFGPPCRWGDYSGASPDPLSPYTVWGSNQAVGPNSGLNPAWKTRNFAVAERAPTASFSFAPASPEANQRVSFTSTSADPDGALAGQAWDLDGDGQFDDAAGSTASRVYTSAGPRTVRLRVVDSLGLAAVATRALTVRRDRTPPSVRLALRRSFRLRPVLRRGLPFRIRSSETGRMTGRLLIGKRAARRLGLVSSRYRKRYFGMARRSARLRAHTTRRLRSRLTRRSRRALVRHRAVRRVRCILRVRVSDRAGNARVVRRRTVLRR